MIRCKSRKCTVCGQLWAGDTRKLIVANLESYGGNVQLATITAPGSELLPPDSDGNVRWTHAYLWNKSAPTWWRRLHKRASQEVKRSHGRVPTILGWVWQYQRRGVLHKHIVLGVGTAAERATAEAYVDALDRLAAEHRFGYVDRGKWDHKRGRRSLRDMTGKHAGRYAAKYLVQRQGDGSYAVSETVTHEDVPPRIVYVSRKLTDGTGVTMRALRTWRFTVATSEPLTPEAALELLTSAGYDRDLVGELLAAPRGP